jgi:hypothetical protein
MDIKFDRVSSMIDLEAEILQPRDKEVLDGYTDTYMMWNIHIFITLSIDLLIYFDAFDKMLFRSQ